MTALSGDEMNALISENATLAAKLAACEAERDKALDAVSVLGARLAGPEGDGYVYREAMRLIRARGFTCIADFIAAYDRAERAEAALGRVGACQRYGPTAPWPHPDGCYMLAADVLHAVRGEGE